MAIKDSPPSRCSLLSRAGSLVHYVVLWLFPPGSNACSLLGTGRGWSRELPKAPVSARVHTRVHVCTVSALCVYMESMSFPLACGFPLWLLVTRQSKEIALNSNEEFPNKPSVQSPPEDFSAFTSKF